MISAEFRKAAQIILGGDESVAAAQALEGLILENNLDDDRYEDILDALSLYSPGHDRPYVGAVELRQILSDFLALDR